MFLPNVRGMLLHEVHFGKPDTSRFAQSASRRGYPTTGLVDYLNRYWGMRQSSTALMSLEASVRLDVILAPRLHVEVDVYSDE